MKVVQLLLALAALMLHRLVAVHVAPGSVSPHAVNAGSDFLCLGILVLLFDGGKG